MSTGELFTLRMKKFVNKRRSKEAEKFTTIAESKRAEPPKLLRRSGRLAEKNPKVEEVKEGPLKRRKLTNDELFAEPVVAGLRGKLTSIVDTLS